MPPFQSSSSRYSALVRRDPLADSHFVYAVLTTSIVCRPTCKARLAQRSNIIFFSTYGAAIAAGFRACKRCKPELEGLRYEPREQSAREACRIILERELQGDSKGKEGGGCGVKLAELAAHAGLTKSHFHRVFKRIIGVTPREFGTIVSVSASKGMLENYGISSSTSSPALPALPIANAPSTLAPGGTQLILSTKSHAYSGLASSSTSVSSTSTPVIVVGATDESATVLPTDLYSAFAPQQDIPTLAKKIIYTIQHFHSGFVILAATNQGICFLDAGDCIPELVHALWLQFQDAKLEASGWSWKQEEGRDYNGVGEIDEMFEEVMQTLVHPTGMIANVPFTLWN